MNRFAVIAFTIMREARRNLSKFCRRKETLLLLFWLQKSRINLMLNYNDLRPGVIFILDRDPYQVLEFSLLKMQQRKPVAQTKIKNLINGKIIDRTFHQNETFQEADIKKEKIKFIYAHRDKFVFCYENDSSKRFELPAEKVGDNAKFLKANAPLESISFEGKIIGLSLPIKMDFEVIEAPPNIKGSTASGGNKIVKIETGAKINVPMFIEQRDIIRINTQTGQYSERIEKAK
jgi:elongation factor P